MRILPGEVGPLVLVPMLQPQVPVRGDTQVALAAEHKGCNSNNNHCPLIYLVVVRLGAKQTRYICTTLQAAVSSSVVALHVRVPTVG